ncbi:hypothetical protein ACFL3H_03770 [Gemmatimonadota bacterium]
MTGTDRKAIGLTTALLALLVLPGIAAAQADLPDFAGRWNLNKERCIPIQATGQMSGGVAGVAIRMDITQEGNKLTVERRNELRGGVRNESTEVFAIDGEPWPQETVSGEMTITAEWKNNSVIVTRTITTSQGGRESQMTQTEMWQYVEQGDMVGMAINIQPAQRAMPGGAQPGGGRAMGGGRGGGGSAGIQNIILVYELRRR